MSKKIGAIGLSALLALAAAGCTSGSGGGEQSASIVTPGASHEPTTITVWTFHKLPNEIAAFKKSLDDLKKKAPWLTVNFVPNKDDAAFAKAVAAGTPPDILISWAPDNVGKFCNDGTVVDMNPYLKASGIDAAKMFLPATLTYTQYQDKQCALPLLTDVYGLYYDKSAFKEAGIKAPPKTFSEFTAAAKKLTKKSADGTITRFGFVPRADYSTNIALYGGTYSGSLMYDQQGKSTLGNDSKWADLLTWGKELTDFYGKAQVDRFVATYNGHTDDAKNALLDGAHAMEVQGEWHIGEHQEYKPNLDYGIAPVPVLDSVADQYGRGLVSGTVLYMPTAGKKQSEAFYVAQQLTTDTPFLHSLADAVNNVPTTNESLNTWKRNSDPKWKVFADILKATPVQKTPASAAGAEEGTAWLDFITKTQTGQVADIPGGLKDLAAKLDNLNDQAKQ